MFKTAGIKFAVLFMFILTVFTISPLQAEDELYTVENILLDKSAANAVIARDEAILEGQREAFKVLVNRLLLEEDSSVEMADISDLQISSMINDFETEQEKFSSKRYRAVMTVRFSPQAVKTYLNRSGGRRIVESRSKPILVLPYLKSEDATFLWSRENPWLKEWQMISSGAGLVPVIIPEGDIQDASAANEVQILMGGQSEISDLLTRYNADKVLLPIAGRTDEGLVIEVYEYIGSELSLVNTINVNNQNPGTMWNEAVKSVRSYINTDWKSRLKYSDNAFQERIIDIKVEFDSMQEWIKLQRTLSSLSQIANIQTQSFNRNRADIKVTLNGSVDDLTNALVGQNMVLNKLTERSGVGSAMKPATYELKQTVSTYSYPTYDQQYVPEERYPVIPPVERLPEQPSLNQNTGVSGSYQYRYRGSENHNKEWDNTYERP